MLAEGPFARRGSSYAEYLGRQGERDPWTLTHREYEILVLCSQGMNSVEIADRFFLAVETIKVHRKNILKKLDAKNMVHAVAIAIRNGWL